MTEKTWGEKPKRWEYAELRSSKIMTGTFGLYRASEMDAWLEKKVKPELDKLEAVKKWYQTQIGLTYTLDEEIIELGKILEAEG